MRKKYVPPRIETIVVKGSQDTMVTFSEGDHIKDDGIEVGAKENTDFYHKNWQGWQDNEDE